jgi:sulfate transport system permease protein
VPFSLTLPRATAPSQPFRRHRRHGVLPGFGLTMGLTLTWLSLIVLIPLSALLLKGASLGPERFWALVSSERALAAYRLTFGAALIAATVDLLFGGLIAWVLVRYRFPGHRLVDAMIDLPFALPTSVAGLALAALYSPRGWIGRHLETVGLHVAFTPVGVVVALIFIGLPFVVRTVQPVLEEAEHELEEAAASLGAGRWQTFRRVILPAIVPALMTGFALALARGIGEYGSVIFIAGNKPLVSEIAPLLIVAKLEQYDYAGATGIALGMLAMSFLMLLALNGLQAWQARRGGDPASGGRSAAGR